MAWVAADNKIIAKDAVFFIAVAVRNLLFAWGA
jgi:hypothetical protein